MHINPTAVILFSFAITSIILSAFLLWKEIGELNRKLPEQNRYLTFRCIQEKERGLSMNINVCILMAVST